MLMINYKSIKSVSIIVSQIISHISFAGGGVVLCISSPVSLWLQSSPRQFQLSSELRKP